MSVNGSLESMHLADLFQWCAANVKTGRLRLRRDPIEKTFFFKEGCLFSSTSNSPRETLVQCLIRSHTITEEQLFEAFNCQEQSNAPLGQVLIQQGAITAEDLAKLLRIKTEESIYDCFLWADGEFAFLDGKLPPIAVATPHDITRLVFEGARRKDEWKRIHEQFRSRYTIFKVETPIATMASDLSDKDLSILSLLSEKKNMVEIAMETNMLEFHVASRLLKFYEKGLIQVDQVPDGISYEQQVEALQTYIRKGATFFNATKYRQALAAFEKALQIDPLHKYARLFAEKLRDAKDNPLPIEEISLSSIPVLMVSINELTDMTLDAEEGFVLSRINGDWDVGSIIKLCPMSKEQVLIIVRRLVDDGVIELTERAPVNGELADRKPSQGDRQPNQQFLNS